MAPEIIKSPPTVPPWLQPLGEPTAQRLLAWGQAQADACLADVFGYHAVQAGWPGFDALQANRMPKRWLAQQEFDDAPPSPDLAFDSRAWPWAAESLDLVVLPHTLERSADPHACLREVERVLRPEGRVVILGLNPASLWAVRQNLARVNGRMLGRPPRLYLPEEGEYIGYWRLRDWLRLLSFEVDRAQFGCYRPPLLSDPWLARWQWIEKPGGKWWTVLGALYGVIAVKRVHGMRLIGMARGKKRAAKTAPAVAAVHHHHHHREDAEVD